VVAVPAVAVTLAVVVAGPLWIIRPAAAVPATVVVGLIPTATPPPAAAARVEAEIQVSKRVQKYKRGQDRTMLKYSSSSSSRSSRVGSSSSSGAGG
jgi:hypothetical protein